MIEARGHNGRVRFDGSFVTIARKGALGRLSVGKGEKSVPVQHITAVQVKPAGAIVNGFISFTLAGGNERQSTLGKQTFNAASDENSVLFTKKQAAAFTDLANAVRAAIAGQAVPQAAAEVDIADQLGKLAALRDSGVLTEAEFAAQKLKLLG